MRCDVVIFRHSKLSRIIDECEPSIVNNTTIIELTRDILPKYNISANYTINLLNPIYYSGVPEDIIVSSGFYLQGDNKLYYLSDDGIGNIQMFYYEFSNKIVVNPTIGTVD